MATTKEITCSATITTPSTVEEYEKLFGVKIPEIVYRRCLDSFRDNILEEPLSILKKASLLLLFRKRNPHIRIQLRKSKRLMKLLEMRDEDFNQTPESDHYFFHLIYHVRKSIGLNQDFGRKQHLDSSFIPSHLVPYGPYSSKVDEPSRPRSICMIHKNRKYEVALKYDSENLPIPDQSHDPIDLNQPFRAEARDSFNDVEIRDSTWTINHRCECYRHNFRTCPIFRLKDWKCHGGTSIATHGYIRNCENAVNSATLLLSLTQRMDKRHKKIANSEVFSSPYIVMACNTPDENFDKCPIEDAKFFQRLYRLRSILRYDANFGFRDQVPRFSAESDDLISEIQNTAVPEEGFLTKIYRKLYPTLSFTKDAWRGAKDLLEPIVNKIMEAFCAALTLVGSAFKTIFDKLKTKIIDFMIKTVFIEPFYNWIVSNGKTILFYVVAAYLVAMTLSIVDIVSEVVLVGIIRLLFPQQAAKYMPKSITKSVFPRPHNILYSAESGVEDKMGPYFAPGLILAFLVGILGKFSGTDMKVIKERMAYTLVLVTGGTVLAKLAHTAFLLLPQALQGALIFRFAPESYRDDYRMQAWKDQAEMLFRLSKITACVTSTEYYTRMNDVIREGPILMERLSTPKGRTYYLGMLTRLTQIATMLEQFKQTGGMRSEPWSMHISSAPGFGKTLIVNKLMRDCFSYTANDVWFRPISDEYWSGYYDQKCVIYDEFLIGDATDRLKFGKEYLAVRSSGQFICPMADLQNPVVGIKGTTAQPEVVVTMNNSPYDVVQGLDSAALQRRRNVNIIIGLTQGTPVDEGGRPVMSDGMDFDSMPWLRFSCIPSTGSNSKGQDVYKNVKTPWLSYRQLVTLIRASFKSHHKIATAIMNSNGASIQITSPQKMMDDMLRQNQLIPSEPLGVMETIKQLYFTNSRLVDPARAFSAEARNPKKPKAPKKNLKHSHECVNCKKVFKSHFGNDDCKDVRCIDCSNVTVEVTNERIKKPEILQPLKPKGFKPVLANIDESISSDPAPEMIEIPKASLESDTDYETTIEEEVVAESDCLKESSRGVTDVEFHEEVVVQSPYVAPKIEPTEIKLRPQPYILTLKPTKEEVAKTPYRVQKTKRDGKFTTCSYPGCRKMYFPEIMYNGLETKGCESHCYFLAVIDDEEVKESEAIPKGEEYKGPRLPYWISRFTTVSWCIDLQGIPIDWYKTYVRTKEVTKEYIWELGIRMGFYVAITGVLMLIRKVLTPNAPPITYCAESIRPAKITQNAARRAPLVRGQFRAEAAEIPHLDLLIGRDSSYGIGLTGHYVLTFSHLFERYVDDLNNGKNITINYKGQSHDCQIIPTTIVQCVENDWVVFEVSSPRLPTFPDSTKRFLGENDLALLNRTDVSLTNGSSRRFGIAEKIHGLTYAANSTARTIEDGYAYRMMTDKGDCGSPIVITSGTYVTKIIGLHIAGSDDKVNPVGVCNIITREELRDAVNRESQDTIDVSKLTFSTESTNPDEDLFLSSTPSGSEIPPPQPLVELFPPDELPNLIRMEETPSQERVHLSTKTKLKKNIIAEHLPYNSVKAPAILSASDKRAADKDPIVTNIRDTLSTEHVVVDEDLVESVYETMYERYDIMEFPVGRRRLTFEEACRGIPGVLSSIRVKTSPGWPLVLFKKKKGKTDFVWFDSEGELCYDESFKELVMQMVEKMKKGEDPNHIWLGYMKDELVSPEKIENARTRTIYASSLIATVAFRMAFGCILAAFNNSWKNTPMSIGANQFSHDMQVFFDYLNQIKGESYIAGDYKSFDKRCHPTFRKFAYDLLTDLAKTYEIDPATENEIRFFQSHELESPAQLGRFRFWTRSNHMSGCFYTTIVNCLVNEGYMRYCFSRLNPHLSYDEHVRLKVLGDDHVGKASNSCKFDQCSIAREMALIGQEYTSDKKGEDIVPFRRFTEITFLGAHPVIVNGHWSGALKKSTLEETCLWTRDNNVTLEETLKQLVELASQWDREYFDDYRSNINKALMCVRINPLVTPGYLELRRIVANRTASSGMLFHGFLSE